jgi:hypothetical protein
VMPAEDRRAFFGSLSFILSIFFPISQPLHREIYFIFRAPRTTRTIHGQCAHQLFPLVIFNVFSDCRSAVHSFCGRGQDLE